MFCERIRMLPGLSTANAPRNSCPRSWMAAEITAAFMDGVSPHKRMSRTPFDACRCLKTSSPKSLSAVISTLAVFRLSRKTTSSVIPGDISAT